MIEQSKYQALQSDLEDINRELRWRQMSDYGHSAFKAFAPRRRWTNSEIRAVKAEIGRLPAVKATREEIPAGTEVAIGDLRRFYVNLTFNLSHGWDEKRFVDVQAPHAAAPSLADYVRRIEHTEVSLCTAVYVAACGAEASGIETREYPESDRYTGGKQDFTTNSIHITMSRAAFAIVEPILRGARTRSASRPEISIILSADVDRSLNLSTRHLDNGEGATFQTVNSGPFQPVRWHLHFFEPPPWPVEGWRNKPITQWPPADYAFAHPVGSWVIEEYCEQEGGDSGHGLLSRAGTLLQKLYRGA